MPCAALTVQAAFSIRAHHVLAFFKVWPAVLYADTHCTMDTQQAQAHHMLARRG